MGVFQSITKAYGRVDPDGSRYLLGDHTGLLSLLVITHEKEKYVITHSFASFGLIVLSLLLVHRYFEIFPKRENS